MEQYKIPILTKVNDKPSRLGDKNHPNDALLCANYNELIDAISHNFTVITTLVSSLRSDVTAITEQSLINLTNGLGELDTRLIIVERLITALENLPVIDTRLNNIDEQLVNITAEAEGAEENINIIDLRLNTTEGNVSAINDSLTIIDGSLLTINGRLDTIEGDVSAIDGRLNIVEQTVNDITTNQLSYARLDENNLFTRSNTYNVVIIPFTSVLAYDLALSNIFKVNLTDNCQLGVPTNLAEGMEWKVVFYGNHSSGKITISLDPLYRLSELQALTLKVGEMYVMHCVYDGTWIFIGFVRKITTR